MKWLKSKLSFLSFLTILSKINTNVLQEEHSTLSFFFYYLMMILTNKAEKYYKFGYEK